MPRLVSAIDICSRRWRLVSLSRSLKEGVRVENALALPPLPLPAWEFMSDSLEEEQEEKLFSWMDEVGPAVSDFLSGSGEVVVGIPLPGISLRVLDLPFTQPARIQQVLPLEAEGTLLHDSEELLFDYCRLSSADSSSRVLSAAVMKSRMSALLNRLKMMNIDPAAVSPAALSLNHLARFSPQEHDPGRRIFLNLEEELIQISAAEGRRSVFASMLILNGASAPGTESGASDRLSALVPLVKRALHFLEGFPSTPGQVPVPVKEIILTGQGAADSKAADALSRELELPASRFRLPEDIVSEPAALSEEAQPAFAGAVALALQKAWPLAGASLNFRKGEFAFRPERKALMRKAVFPAAMILALLVCLLVRASFSGSFSRQKEREARREMAEVFKSHFPGVPVTNPAVQVKAMLEQLNAKQLKYEELMYPSALACLAEISRAIPESVSVRLTGFEYRGDRVSISGTAQTLEEPNEITKRLSQVPFFASVKLEDSRQMPREGYRFKISINLKKPGVE